MASHEFDAFVSFSHLDDKSPNGRGWVTAFYNALEMWLTRRLGRASRIWHDRRRLTGECEIDETIRKAIDNSAVLLVLYSAGYASSEYCAKEREWFAKNVIKVGDKSRALTIRLANIPHEEWPKELQGCPGFDFFSVKPNDQMGYPIRTEKRAFEEKVKDVVNGIEAVLKALEGAPSTARPPRIVVPPSVEPVGMLSSVSQMVGPVSQEERGFALLNESFKFDFQKCFAQIKLLSGRKEIHDQLHELQFKFYIPVLESLPDASTSIDGQLLDIVRDHYFTLSEIVDNLRAIVARYKEYLPDKEQGFLEEVAKARTVLDEGIRRRDLVSMRCAVRKIDRVLAFWPSQMNARLTENARELALGTLAKKLQQLCDHSASFKQQLGQKASQLEALEEQISALAAIHDDCQSFDNDLRALDSTLTQSLQDIEDIWPDLQGKTETLCAQNSETWAEPLIYWGGQIDQALKQKSVADAKRCFIRFSSAARKRFYLADQDLKKSCQLLQLVGDPIEALLRAR
jgi:TIR domain